MPVLWDVALCSVVDIDRRFRGGYNLHHQGNDRPDDGEPVKRLPTFTKQRGAASKNLSLRVLIIAPEM